MNIIKSILFPGLFCAIAFAACEKQLDTDKVNFEVTTNKTTYKVGDTVTFKFAGNPDNITFFSGEEGYKYEFRSRIKATGKPQFQFTSYAQFGVQTNTLQVLASTDFSGIVDQNIANGGWKDITNLTTLSTGTDNTASGVVDLTQFIGDKPLYLAYHFVGQAGTTQRTWTIKNFSVQNKLNDGPLVSVADQITAGFTQISLKNPSAVWVIAADNIKITGGNTTSLENDDWVVSKPLNLDKVSPDVGVALKNITTKMTSYPYIFTKAGTYKITFLATNATVNKSESVVKELTITVEP
jgi:hypothetical protein